MGYRNPSVVMIDPETGNETRENANAYYFKRGAIQSGGLTTFDPDVNKYKATPIILGGTGAFDGTRGTRTSEALGDNWFKITFHLID